MTKIKVYSANVGKEQAHGYPTFTEYNRFNTDRMNAKIYKVLSHLYVDADWSIYVDANITLNKTPGQLLEMCDKDVCVFHHKYRDCLYDEADVCRKEYDAAEIDVQVARYRDAGFPEHAGLGSCCLIIRKHTPEVARLNEQWWAEICRGSYRDQISFPFVFDGNVQYLPKADHLKPNEYFTVHNELR